MTKKTGRAGCVSFLCVLLMLGVTLSAQAQEIIDIDVAPNVLNLASSGTVVTVHTDISYSAVAGATVLLNDVPISWWKSDNQGNFVAKFAMENIEALFDPITGTLDLGLITLTLSGETKDGSSFEGSQDILVIDFVPRPQGGRT